MQQSAVFGYLCTIVKLNNPLMGTETVSLMKYKTKVV